MTKAIFVYFKNCFTVSIKGHAQYENGGGDIVCAAASMLAYTLLQSLHRFETNGELTIKSEQINDKKGSFEIDCCYNEKAKHRVMASLKTIIGGYELLSKQYIEHVSVKEVYKTGEQ